MPSSPARQGLALPLVYVQGCGGGVGTHRGARQRAVSSPFRVFLLSTASPLPPQLILQDMLLVTGTALPAERSPHLRQVNRGMSGEAKGPVLWGAPRCCHKPGRQATCSRGPASDGCCGRCVHGKLSVHAKKNMGMCRA